MAIVAPAVREVDVAAEEARSSVPFFLASLDLHAGTDAIVAIVAIVARRSRAHTHERTALGGRAVRGHLRYKGSVRARALLAFAISIASVSSTPRAWANGRFPQAQVIETVPGGDGTKVFMRTTFGVLVSEDAGKSFQLLCERALGYDGTWDPPIAVTRDARLWVGLEDGLTSTRDGCTVERSPELEGRSVTDLTVDPRGETVWAITGSPTERNAIWRRRLGEPAFRRVGEAPENVHWMTIEVAPSRASRLYLTGQPYGSIRGQVFVSDDGGATITAFPNDLAAEGPFFIAAVDPKNPDHLLLRHLHTKGSDVLSTRDRGKTLGKVLGMESAMFGFAKSPDGRTYWAASGLAEHGIFRSTDGGDHWSRVAEYGVLCLHAAPGGRLFVCENTFKLGAPAMAVSLDQGRSIASRASFADVKGPPACRGDGGAALCDASWPALASAIVRGVDAGDERGEGTDDPPVDAGASSDGRDAGTSPASRRPACGCSVVGEPTSPPDRTRIIAGVAALALGSWSRARRGSRSIQRDRR